jgi:solute carrier family 25 protein 33/36
MYQVVAADGSFSFRASPLRATWMHVAGTMNSLHSIYVKEGITALWRGMGPTIVGVMPSRAIYFSTYATTKQLLSSLNDGQENSLIHLSGALTAGVVTSTATNPIWLVKTRMQLQSSQKGVPLYRNSFHCLRVVAKTEGLRGLYKGLTASYLGSLEGTIQWVLYEKAKKAVSIHRHRAAGTEYTSATAAAPLTWLDFFLTAASAKLVAAIIAYPHEVLRTRLREDTNKYRGLMQTTARILREEGLAAFYGGMTAHLMRVVPNSAIMFFCYEFLVHGFTRLAPDS